MRLEREVVPAQEVPREPLDKPLMKKAFEQVFPYTRLLTENQRAQFVRAITRIMTGRDTQPVEPIVADAIDCFTARL